MAADLARKLLALTEASTHIHKATRLDEALTAISEEARRIIGAHQSIVTITREPFESVSTYAVSLSDKYGQWRDYRESPRGSGVYTIVCRENRPVRMTQAELEAHPAWRGFGEARDRHPPMRGWLAAPLVDRAGANMGVVQLSDRYEGDFDATDETLLIQLAAVASVAIENVQLAEETHAAQEMFRAPFEDAAVGITVSATDGRLLRTNEAFCRIVGYSAEELAEIDVFSITHPDDVDENRRLYAQMLSGEIPSFVIEKRYIHRDERIVWVKSSVSVLRDSGGAAIRTIALVEDITERKEHEAALELALQKNRRMIESSQDVIATIDRYGNFVEVSARCREVWGYEPEELVGTPYMDLVHEDDRDPTYGVVDRLVAQQLTPDLQNRHVHRNGRVVHMHWSSVWSPEDRLFYVVGRDISYRVEIEEQLRQSQRLEAVGQLTGGVAHDFNNLLTVILGSAEIMMEELPEDHRLRMVAEMTRTAAERGADLTRGLLAFARRQALEPKVTDINRLVGNMDGLFRRTLNEDIDIEMVRGGGLWTALIDPAQLESVLLNLAINARDAMPEGGRLTIETANVHLDDSYAKSHEEVAPGQYVMIAVADTGLGMPPDVIDRAFEPFFTTKEVGKGSGLGLSMVYGFTKQSGGHVKIYSEVGYGTVVKLYLPRAGEVADIVVEAGDGEMDRGAESILLVEDDELVREHVESQLLSLGYRVRSVGDGQEALIVLKQNADIDLLFTDVVMPGGINGRQLADEARKLRPGLPVLFTSGYTENAIVHHGRLDRGVHLINKPYRRQELAAKIRVVFRDAAKDEHSKDQAPDA